MDFGDGLIVALGILQNSAQRAMSGLLLAVCDPCLPVVPANTGVLWPAQIRIKLLDLGFQTPLDGLVDQNATRALGQIVER